MEVDGTGMVVTIDLDHANIHPPNKIDAGERLALWPLAKLWTRRYPSVVRCFGKPRFGERRR